MGWRLSEVKRKKLIANERKTLLKGKVEYPESSPQTRQSYY
jgi:hypothetical protein